MPGKLTHAELIAAGHHAIAEEVKHYRTNHAPTRRMFRNVPRENRYLKPEPLKP